MKKRNPFDLPRWFILAPICMGIWAVMMLVVAGSCYAAEAVTTVHVEIVDEVSSASMTASVACNEKNCLATSTEVISEPTLWESIKGFFTSLLW